MSATKVIASFSGESESKCETRDVSTSTSTPRRVVTQYDSDSEDFVAPPSFAVGKPMRVSIPSDGLHTASGGPKPAPLNEKDLEEALRAEVSKLRMLAMENELVHLRLQVKHQEALKEKLNAEKIRMEERLKADSLAEAMRLEELAFNEAIVSSLQEQEDNRRLQFEKDRELALSLQTEWL